MTAPIRRTPSAMRRCCKVSDTMLFFFAGFCMFFVVSNWHATSDGTTESSSSLLEAVPRSLVTELEQQSKSLLTWGSNKDFGKYPPFRCATLLQELKNDPQLQLLDPNNGIIHARRTIEDSNYYISLHNKLFDKTRWSIMKYGFYYERALVRAFQKVLSNSPPGSRVIDVGGNIGVFSLLAASLGPFIVDTFEPNIRNRLRYCESLNLNRWYQTEFDAHIDSNVPQMNVYPFGVGDKEGDFIFAVGKNPGQGRVMDATANKKELFSIKENVTETEITIVTLDSFARERGWLESLPHIAILKIDVEGFEFSVMAGAKQLLSAGIVRNVFMEISVRTEEESNQNVPFLTFLSQDAGYELHRVGGWRGPNEKEVKWRHSKNLVSNILDAARAEEALQLNLWWKLPDSKVQLA